jgi:hypothetical protein
MLVYCAVRRPEIDYLRVIRLAQGTRISTNALTIDSLYILGLRKNTVLRSLSPRMALINLKSERWREIEVSISGHSFYPFGAREPYFFDKSIIVGERSINAFFSGPQSE